MDLYDYKVVIENATFYDSAIEKQTFFNDSLEIAKQNFEQKSNELIKYLINENSKFTLNGKELIFNLENRKPITHNEYYETKYNSFIKTKLFEWRIAPNP